MHRFQVLLSSLRRVGAALSGISFLIVGVLGVIFAETPRVASKRTIESSTDLSLFGSDVAHADAPASGDSGDSGDSGEGDGDSGDSGGSGSGC